MDIVEVLINKFLSSFFWQWINLNIMDVKNISYLTNHARVQSNLLYLIIGVSFWDLHINQRKFLDILKSESLDLPNPMYGRLCNPHYGKLRVRVISNSIASPATCSALHINKGSLIGKTPTTPINQVITNVHSFFQINHNSKWKLCHLPQWSSMF